MRLTSLPRRRNNQGDNQETMPNQEPERDTLVVIRHRVLVVGSEISFVNDHFAPHLLEHGLRVDWHWDWDKKHIPSRLPVGCTLIINIKDMAGHRHRTLPYRYAKQADIPFVDCQRKWCHAKQMLITKGLIKDPALNKAAQKEPDMPGKYINDLNAIRHFVKAQGGRRPSPEEVDAETNVGLGFLGMTRGINEGIALGQAESGHKKGRQQAKDLKQVEHDSRVVDVRELATMLIEDDPRLILDPSHITSYIKDCLDSPPPTQQVIKRITMSVQDEFHRVFKVGSRRGQLSGQEAEDRARLMKLRETLTKLWFLEALGLPAFPDCDEVDDDAREAIETTISQMPPISALQSASVGVFGSKIPMKIIDETRERLTPEALVELVEVSVAPEVEQVERVVAEPSIVLPGKAAKKVLAQAHLIGTMKDGDLGEKLDVSRETVRKIRNQMNIPPFKASGPEPKAIRAKDGVVQEVSDKDFSVPIVVLPEGEISIEDVAAVALGTAKQPVEQILSDFHDDKAAQIGAAVAQLIRLGCEVSFSINTPSTPSE